MVQLPMNTREVVSYYHSCMVAHAPMLSNNGKQCLALTLPMPSLSFLQSTRTHNLWKASKPCHVGIHWIALHEYSQMSTHLPGFQSFFRFLYHFVLAKSANSIRVKDVRVSFGHSTLQKSHSRTPKLFCGNFLKMPISSKQFWNFHLVVNARTLLKSVS